MPTTSGSTRTTPWPSARTAPRGRASAGVAAAGPRSRPRIVCWSPALTRTPSHGARPHRGRARTRRGDGPEPVPSARGAEGSEAEGRLEVVGAGGVLPGELRLVAAEVPVGRGLLVDRAAQVEVAEDGPGA